VGDDDNAEGWRDAAMLRCRDESSPSRGDRVGEVGGRWSVVVILILSTDFLPQPFFRRQRKSKATPSICWPKRVAANENRQRLMGCLKSQSSSVE